MNQQSAERRLAYLFPVVGVLSGITCISFGIAWYHWKDVLETCGTYNTYDEPKCGCILFGSSTATYFIGGPRYACAIVGYGPLISVIICLLFGCFHMYRVCCGVAPVRQETKTIRQRTGEMVVVTSRSPDTLDDISPSYWPTLGVISIIATVIMFILAVVYTCGYVISCNQYRYEAVKYIQAAGSMLQAIHGRLSCNAIFDIMDYIHPDVSYEKHRIERINSAFALGIPLMAYWMIFVGWIGITVIAFARSRATRVVRM